MKKKRVKPDDYFSAGPLEFARFGKNVVMHSNATPEQLEALHKVLLENLPDIESRINLLVTTAVDIINRYNPTVLLHRAYWAMASHHTVFVTDDSHTQVDTETDDALTTVRTLEYIQNIVVSTPPSETQKNEVDDDEWIRLVETIRELYKTFNNDYLLAESIRSRKEEQLTDEVAAFRTRSIAHWVNVRGERYSNYEEEHLEDMLLCQSELIEDVLGIPAKILVGEISKIQNSLINGVGESAIEMGELHELVMTELEKRLKKGNLNLTSEEEMRSEMLKIVGELGLSERRERAGGRFLGLDLFDLQEVTELPKEVLEKLSWKRGEETTFLTGDKYVGWPTRIPPISRKPFLSYNGKFYCFCVYGLFDNFYRVIQRLIFSERPERKSEWVDKQKEITEALPFRAFNKLLAGNLNFKEVYYKWYPNDNVSKVEWCETDGIIIYGDNLLILEVKGGSFTYTSPFDDFQAHIKSIEMLVQKPATQGERFASYLASSAEVVLYDLNKAEIARISKDTFRRITICALTADPITEIASQVQHLKGLGVQLGNTPTWSISIDDLRVCRDIFSNPLIFLHYLEKRMDASKSLKVNVDDELDHLALYFEHNDYTIHAEEMSDDVGGDIRFNGYRQRIDEYFHESSLGSEVAALQQKDLPENISAIIHYCSMNSPVTWVSLTSYLLNGDASFREQISKEISHVLRVQGSRKKVQVISTSGEMRITVACWQPHLFKPDQDFLHEHVKTEIVLHGESDRQVLQLFFGQKNSISDLKWSKVFASDIHATAMDHDEEKVREIRERRVMQARQKNGKIGRNSRCPCGSGKKFKKCCEGA